MKQLFSNLDYCVSEMMHIKRMMEDKIQFNFKNIHAAKKSFSFMILYCPVHLYTSILVLLNELLMREEYLRKATFGGEG